MAVRFSADGQHYTRAVSGVSIWSACFWYYSVSATGGPFAYGNTNAGGSTVFLTGGSTLKLFDLGPNSGGFGSMPITDGVWYRIAIVVNGTDCTWYHGTESGSLTSASVANIQSPTSFTQQWSIGYDSFDADTIDGRLGNVKIWTGVARTEAEFIAELATYSILNATGNVQLHPFLVAETTDHSGNNNTLSGGVGATTEDGPPIGAPEVTGTVAASLGSLSATVVGTVGHSGVVAANLGGLTATAVGSVRHSGAVVSSLGGLSATAVGGVSHPGAVVATLGPLTATVVGTVRHSGTVVVNLGALLTTASGATAEEVTGSVSVNLGALLAVVVGSGPATTQTGSWYGLLEIYREAAQYAREDAARKPVACPQCGEPLSTSRRGQSFCRFDGWQPA